MKNLVINKWAYAKDRVGLSLAAAQAVDKDLTILDLIQLIKSAQGERANWRSDGCGQCTVSEA